MVERGNVFDTNLSSQNLSIIGIDIQTVFDRETLRKYFQMETLPNSRNFQKEETSLILSSFTFMSN